MSPSGAGLRVRWRVVGEPDPAWLAAMAELGCAADLTVIPLTMTDGSACLPQIVLVEDVRAALAVSDLTIRPIVLARQGNDAAIASLLAAGAEDCLVGAEISPELLRHAVRRAACRQKASGLVSEISLGAFWNAMPMHCALLSDTGEILAVNESWHQDPTGGLSGGLAVGQNYLAACDAAGIEVAGFTSALREVLAGERDQLVYEHAAHRLGVPQWFEARAWWLPGKARALVSHLDVTERRLSDDALRLVAGSTALLTGEAFFKGLVKQVAELFGARYAFFVENDPAAEGLLTTIASWVGGHYGGSTTFPIAGSPCESVLSGSGIVVPTAVQERFPACVALQALGVDGFLGMPAYDAAGRVIGVLAVMHDGPLAGVALSDVAQRAMQMLALRAGSELERMHAERALRASEERLTLALDGTRAIMWEYRFDRQQLYFGREMMGLWGCDPAELSDAAASWWAAVHPEDRPAIRRIWMACGAGAQSEFEAEYRLLNRAGDYRWVMVRGKVVGHCAETSSLRLIGIMLDITDRKVMERALADSEERFRLVARATQDVVWDWDIATGSIECTDHGAVVFGYEAPPFVTLEWSRALIHPDDRDQIQAGLETALAGDRTHWSVECRLRQADGGYGHAHIQAWIVRDAQGQAVRMVGALVDVTARKQLETQLMLTNRMTSMGVLAAGVAHEINNPLAYALSNQAFAIEQLRALAADAPSDDRFAAALDALEEARDGARRVRDIVRDLKLFSRPDDDSLGPVDVVGVVETAIGMISHAWRHRARLERMFEKVSPVHANASQLVQVFLNLIHNAVQAIPEGADDQHFIHVAIRQEGAERVVVEIVDSGCGIPAALLDRVFDPFYTTKPVGEGTGLGLAICQRLVGRFGGEIRVESLLDQGSTFRVSLPASLQAIPAPLPQVPEAVTAGARILVVDDEPLIGKAICRALGREHDVHVVSGGRAALARLSSGEQFDLVLCDLMMPDLSGMDLYELLVAQGLPGRDRFVFLSGGAFLPRTQHFLDTVDRPHLMKPFELAKLRQLVADALAMRAGTP